MLIDITIGKDFGGDRRKSKRSASWDLHDHMMTSWYINASALVALCEGNPSLSYLTGGFPLTKGQLCRAFVLLLVLNGRRPI